ncbi:ATP-grasp domain-containing protein [Providencia rettgeri]|nr:ATP-grasp domain-containing protein [Providencia rettgeri]
MKVGIVDAFSTGVNLASDFIAKGVECYHIRTTRTVYPYDLSFKDTLYFDDNNLIEYLIDINLSYIIAGSEMGVEITDYLNDKLNKKHSNEHNTTLKRRNKYLMQRALCDKRIRCISQFISSCKEEIINWVIRHNKFPVVIKPLDSAASDGVTVCDDFSGVEIAIDNILGKKNIFGKTNEQILVQEFICGTQYFVNTLTWDGKTYITDIWEQVRTRNRNQSFRFEGMKLCAGDIAITKKIKNYIIDVLSALELNYGPAHNEVILTDKGPVLIESNARLMGASIADNIFKENLGYTQSSLCADMYINPNKFLSSFYDKEYEIKFNIYEISFLFKKDGFLIRMPKKELLEKLASFNHFYSIPKFNRYVTSTVDTQGEPGFLYLSHQSKDIIESEFDFVLSLQKNDEIFEIK